MSLQAPIQIQQAVSDEDFSNILGGGTDSIYLKHNIAEERQTFTSALEEPDTLRSINFTHTPSNGFSMVSRKKQSSNEVDNSTPSLSTITQEDLKEPSTGKNHSPDKNYNFEESHQNIVKRTQSSG